MCQLYFCPAEYTTKNGMLGVENKRIMYQLKVDVDKLNVVKVVVN